MHVPPIAEKSASLPRHFLVNHVAISWFKNLKLDIWIKSFEVISAENGIRNVSHNKDVGKGSTETKVELKQALAIGFDACSVDGLMGEVTVGPLAIWVCVRVDHEAILRITLNDIKQAA